MRLAPAIVLILCCLSAAPAAAQVVGGGPVGNFPGLNFNPFGGSAFGPDSGFMPGMNGMGNQQLGAMMGMSMLGGFGNRGVQTGVANPFMNSGFGSQPQLYYEPPASSSGSASSGKAKHSGSSAKPRGSQSQACRAERLAALAKAEKSSKKPRKTKDQ